MTNAMYFHHQGIFLKTLCLIDTELGRTKEDFIVHFREKYANQYPPAWMIAEIVSLGAMCNLYTNLNSKSLQKKIANHFQLPIAVFSSWLLSLINIRNFCGHHHRIWNREIPLIPTDLKNPTFPWINTSNINMKRIYYRICMIKYLLFTISPNNTFTETLKSLLAQYPTVDRRAMGFPDNWENEPLWQ